MPSASASRACAAPHPRLLSAGEGRTPAGIPPSRITPTGLAHDLHTSRHRLTSQGVKERTQDLVDGAVVMEVMRTAILLLHPFAALLVIRIFMKQREWRAASRQLKGAERAESLTHHESTGTRVLLMVIGLIALAFAAKATTAILGGESLSIEILEPGHFHGWVGLLGLTLMIYLWRLGSRTRDLKSAGERFVKTRDLHGRVADAMAVLVVIHAFLGFLYLLQIL